MAMPTLRRLFPPLLFAAALYGQIQERDRAIEAQPVKPPETEQRSRIFFIIPNNRTYPSLTNYKPLTAAEKFKLAAQDAFDPGTFVMAAAFAGEGQLTNATPSFHQGLKGYGRYFAASYADFAIGDFMTEAVVPTALHQDPRYFRRGTGSGFSRTLYAMKQIFWIQKDSGGRTFNFSEFGGNAIAVGISNAYYPDNRNASDNVVKLGTYIAVDMVGNIMKEFWPDIAKKLSRKPKSTASAVR